MLSELFGDISPKTINVRVLCHKSTLTAASLIERLLDGYERRQRMEAFGSAIREADAAYWDEFRAWDVASSDA